MKRFLPWCICAGVVAAGCSLANDPAPSVDPSSGSGSGTATGSGGSGASGSSSSTGGATSSSSATTSVSSASAGGAGGGAVSECGNGIIEGAEQCDGGGETSDCDVDCTKPACGDGHRNGSVGEQCDDGNLVEGDACSKKCDVTAFDIAEVIGGTLLDARHTPDVAVVASGGNEAFSVAWVGENPAVPFRRVYEPSGLPTGVAEPVSTLKATGSARHAENELGHTVVAWPSAGQMNELRYLLLGNNVSSVVPSAVPGPSLALAVAPKGNHCVAWVDGGSGNVNVRCLDAATSTPIGTQNTVVGTSCGGFNPVSLLALPGGLVAWWRDTFCTKVLAQRLTPEGMKLGTTYPLDPSDSPADLGSGVGLSDGSYIVANTFYAKFGFPSQTERVALTRVAANNTTTAVAIAIDMENPTEHPALAGAGGSDVVLFVSVSPCELRGQRYQADAKLTKLGPSFSVPGVACGPTRAVANKAGDVMVVWGEYQNVNFPLAIRAAIYPGLLNPKS